jgi:MFS transporter, Spinster family, sphingosine-1-phosphate transporter
MTNTKPPTGARDRYSYYALVTLTLLNLLNYVDRFIFAALIPYIKQDAGYTDEQLGYVGSAFTIVYTVCSPLFGYLGDRYHRGRLIALGISIWSLATAGAGVARTFTQLLISRSLVGVGEANYATIAPGLLSDFFIKSRRGMIMSIFFAAIPVGTAIGYLAGGYLGAPERLGWRNALFLVGLPGILTSAAAYWMREPQRGVMDEKPQALKDTDATAEKPLGWFESYKLLFANRGFIMACLGYAAITFALGALVFWAPEWLRADKGLTPESANAVLGVCAIVGGFVGTMLGGAIGDWLAKRVRGAYFWVCAASSAMAAIPMFIATISQNKSVFIPCIFIGMTLVFLGNGPVNALLVNLTPPHLRTTALGLNVVIIHVLGDGLSLSLVGKISTTLSTMKNELPGFIISLGDLFHLNPGTQTLSVALLLMPIAMLLSGLFYLAGLKTAEGRAV